MANLNELAQWEAGIYQLETTDPVVGGPEGISNLQAKLLANRTAYLKAQLEALGSELAALGITDISGLQAALDGKVPWGAADAVIAAAGLTPDHTNLGQLLQALQAMGLRDATETLNGRVELATAAEVLAGTDAGRAVTPAGLLAGLLGAGGAGISDYVMIPFRDKVSGVRRELIVQWSSIAFTSSAVQVFTFPIAFTEACKSVVGLVHWQGSTPYLSLESAPSLSSVSLRCSVGASAINAYVIAIGI